MFTVTAPIEILKPYGTTINFTEFRGLLDKTIPKEIRRELVKFSSDFSIDASTYDPTTCLVTATYNGSLSETEVAQRIDEIKTKFADKIAATLNSFVRLTIPYSEYKDCDEFLKRIDGTYNKEDKTIDVLFPKRLYRHYSSPFDGRLADFVKRYLRDDIRSCYKYIDASTVKMWEYVISK